MEVLKDWRGALPSTGGGWVLLLFTAGFSCAYGAIKVATTNYRFTDEGMVYSHGIINRQHEYLDYSRMHSINTKTNIITGGQVELEYGHHHMKVLPYILNNTVVVNELRYRAKSARRKMGVHENDIL